MILLMKRRLNGEKSQICPTSLLTELEAQSGARLIRLSQDQIALFYNSLFHEQQ